MTTVDAPADASRPDHEHELLVAAETAIGLGPYPAGDAGPATMALYASWYVRLFDVPAPPPDFPVDLTQVLRAADATAATWADGWVADRVHPDGRVIARRGREVRMADRCDHLAVDHPGSPPVSGDRLVLAARRDRIDPDGDWWRTAGRGWRFTRSVPDVARVYWNVGIEALPVLVGRLTGLLADVDEPWMLKCAVDPDHHVRPDATVLYLSVDLLDRVADDLDAVAADHAADLVDGVPPLTLTIAPGVAVAFDPPPGESFGEHRCRLVVEATTTAVAGAAPSDRRSLLGALRRRFDAEDIDLARPWAARTDRMLPWER